MLNLALVFLYTKYCTRCMCVSR